MRKKLAIWMMCIGLGAALLTGCGKPTVESLVDNLIENPVDSETTGLEFEIVLSLGSETRGLSVDISAEGDFEIQAEGLSGDSDESVEHLKGDFSYTFLGPKETIPFDAYTVIEGDYGIVYTYDAYLNDWYYTEADLSDYDALVDQDTKDEIIEALWDAFKENGELQKDTGKVEGIECYVITAVIDGDQLAGALEPLGDIILGLMEEIGYDIDIDPVSCFEYFNMDVTAYISKADGWLVKSEMSLKDSDLYGAFMEITDGMDYGDLTDELEFINFKECSFTCVFSDQNDTEVEVPENIPEDAIAREEHPIYNDVDGGTPDGAGRPGEKPGWEETEAGSGNNDGDNGNSYQDGYVSLYKSAAPDELLCNVNIPDGCEYIDMISNPVDGYFYMGLAGSGIVEVRNEARFPLYDYLTYGSVSFEGEHSQDEESHMDYTCVIDGIVGTAFGGSDCVHVRESYYDAQFDLQFDTEYLVIEYDNNGSPEYLTVWIIPGEGSGDWSDSDYLELARDLFGE